MEFAFLAVIFSIALRAIEMICFARQSNCAPMRARSVRCDGTEIRFARFIVVAAVTIERMRRHWWLPQSSRRSCVRVQLLCLRAQFYCIQAEREKCSQSSFATNRWLHLKSVFECFLLTCIPGKTIYKPTICSTHRSSGPHASAVRNRMTFNLCSCKHRYAPLYLPTHGGWWVVAEHSIKMQSTKSHCFLLHFSKWFFHLSFISIQFSVDIFFHVFSAHSTISVHRSSFCSTISAMLPMVSFLRLVAPQLDGLHGAFIIYIALTYSIRLHLPAVAHL